MNNGKKILQAAMRTDFFSFVQKSFYEVDNSQTFILAAYLKIMTDKLQQCAEGKIKRLIINIPPRKLKSNLASIALPAWLLGRNPNERIICVSYSQELANKFSRDRKKLMNSDFYKETFSTRLNPDKQTENLLETTKNGYCYATSVGGTLTGFGGTYIIIDDPIKANDALSQVMRESVNEWYDNTLSSRLDNKNEGVIILVMQRLHLDDLTAHLLKQDGWEVLSLPAIATSDKTFTLSNGKEITIKAGEVLCPEIEPLEEVLKLQKTMSNYNFNAQYLQEPIPEKGNIIDFSRFKYFDTVPPGGTVFQSWDIAFKTGRNNDYTICITAIEYEGNTYITDIYRDKIDIANLPLEIISRSQMFQCRNIIIEATTSTELLLQTLAQRGIYPIKYTPKDSKEIRANYASEPLEYGQVFLKRNAQCLDDFRSEILAFPHGRHDDQVDAFSQLIIGLKQKSLVTSTLERVTVMANHVKSEEYQARKYARFKRFGLGKLF